MILNVANGGGGMAYAVLLDQLKMEGLWRPAPNPSPRAPLLGSIRGLGNGTPFGSLATVEDGVEFEEV